MALCECEGLPRIHTPTGTVRYRVQDVVRWDNVNLRAFTYQGLSPVLDKCKGLDARQRTEVMEAVRVWLKQKR